jgi:hypothetical protein
MYVVLFFELAAHGGSAVLPGIERLPRSRRMLLHRPFLAYGLDDLRYQLRGYHHDGLTLGAKSRFVFRDLLIFALTFVVLGELADSRFIPSGGIRLRFLLGHFFFPRWRLRNARFALGVRSKAVTTNAPSPTESST